MLKVYDGIYARNNPATWWKGRMREMDITVDNDHPLAIAVDKLFEEVLKYYTSKGATFVDPSLTANSGDLSSSSSSNNNNFSTGVGGKRAKMG